MLQEAENKQKSDILQQAVHLVKENQRLAEEKEKAEEQLQRANRQNQLILNSAGEGIYGLDSDGVTTFINPAAEKMLGYKEKELLGKKGHFIIHHSRPDGSPYPHEDCHIYASACTVGTVHKESEEVFWRKDGTSFPVEYVSTPIRENEKLVGAVVTFKDITERKKVEQALKESEIRANAILNNAIEGFITIDEQGIIQSFNPAAEKLFGYQTSEILGKNVTHLIPEHFRDAHNQGMSNYLATGVSKVIGIGAEVVGLRKDGSTFPLDLGISEMYLGETRMFTGIVRNITERKKAEQALRESEIRANAVLNNAIDGIITIDEQGTIKSFNSAAEKLFGYQTSERLGTNIKFLMPEPFQTEHDLYLQNYLETGISKIIGIGREVIGLRKNGSTFPADLEISEMYLGETRMFTGMIRNITERKKAEAQQQMQYELTKTFLDSQSLEDTLPRILQAIGEFMEWEISYYWEKKPESDVLNCRSAWNTPDLNENEDFNEFKKISVQRTFKKGTGLPGRVWDELQPSWISDVRCDTNFPRAPFAKKLGMKSGFGFPVFFRKQFLGVIEVFTRQQCQPDTHLIQMMTHLGGQIGQWMRLKKGEEHLDKLNLKILD